MISIQIPGYKIIEIKNIALDFNGTMAVDGKILSGVKEILNDLSSELEIFVVTADTYGNVREEIAGIQCSLNIISEQNQDYTKRQFIRQLGKEHTVAIGNGKNDVQMLEEAELSIAIIQKEGCAVGAIHSADLLFTNIIDALDIFRNTLRLKASLRA